MGSLMRIGFVMNVVGSCTLTLISSVHLDPIKETSFLKLEVSKDNSFLYRDHFGLWRIVHLNNLINYLSAVLSYPLIILS